MKDLVHQVNVTRPVDYVLEGDVGAAHGGVGEVREGAEAEIAAAARGGAEKTTLGDEDEGVSMWIMLAVYGSGRLTVLKKKYQGPYR